MAEKEEIFSSEVEYTGIFSFKDYYKFCYEWLKDETGLDLAETKYEEKLTGDAKEIKVEWTGEKKVTDYFKFEIKVSFTVKKMKEIEINKGGVKIKMNDGDIKTKVKGNLVRDYNDKFEGSGFKKFLRETYEKVIIPSRMEQFKDKIAEDCNDFLSEAKAYLDLEGKK